MPLETTTQMNENAYSYINLSYMDMMSDGDPDMKKVMLEMLLEELPTELEKMRQLALDGNWAELCAVSHKMKSTMAFVGNEEMTQANSKIELLTKDKTDLGQISGLIATLQNIYPNSLGELKAEFERL